MASRTSRSGEHYPVASVSGLMAEHALTAGARWLRYGVLLTTIALVGCEDLAIHDAQCLFVPRLHRSEIFGFVAGFGTTFAAVPDLIAMFRKRSAANMSPRMAAILCVFQVIWIYYGLLIGSRPVIAWNFIAVVINALSVGANRYFSSKARP